MNENGYRTTYLYASDAGHLVHDEAPLLYRQAVESFLAAR
jgi:pimeloyl-ACP methyl ester carboxylesterase